MRSANQLFTLLHGVSEYAIAALLLHKISRTKIGILLPIGMAVAGQNGFALASCHDGQDGETAEKQGHGIWLNKREKAAVYIDNFLYKDYRRRLPRP